MHLHTVYMEYSECLPTLLNPLAERTCFAQVGGAARRLQRPGGALPLELPVGQQPAVLEEEAGPRRAQREKC
jgi:hypothetical protein